MKRRKMQEKRKKHKDENQNKKKRKEKKGRGNKSGKRKTNRDIVRIRPFEGLSGGSVFFRQFLTPACYNGHGCSESLVF
jgi:hypothetical protein